MSHIRFSLKFHAEHDADVIKILNQQESINDYIRQLVRADGIMMSIIDDMAAEDAAKQEAKDPQTIVPLIYEWIEHRGDYRLYNPLEPEQTVAYLDKEDLFRALTEGEDPKGFEYRYYTPDEWEAEHES